MPPLLLFDGDCAFCARSVQFILRRDRRATLRFASRSGVTARALEARHPSLVGVDSLVWVDGDAAPERVRVRSDAALAVARYLGGPWALLATVGGVIPRQLRDAAYDVVARNRRRFGGPEVCAMVAAEIRGRELP
ncbi:MAG: DUF393 domain-containing protein [Gemmatimonadaceae bacterium]|nr:DUF393 domain-containing protein [Gemmatimonadaceae bacterium]